MDGASVYERPPQFNYDLMTMRNERFTAMFEAVCGNVKNARCKSDQKIARTDEFREQDI